MPRGVPKNPGKMIFSQKICRLCGLKFRPTASGREVDCQICKAEIKAAKIPRTRRTDIARRLCKECKKRFRPYSERDEFCCDECRDDYWRRYRAARAREDRGKLRAKEATARRKPEVVVVGDGQPTERGPMGRRIQGDEFLRLKQLYEARDAGQIEGHVI